MPIRRLNFTKRRKLTREEVRVSIERAPNRPPAFRLELSLPEGLPRDAGVFLEAYRSSPPARMRFDLGKAGGLRLPYGDDALLTEFHDELPPPLFRLKVTDASDHAGRILAEATGLRPSDPLTDGTRKGLLYINYKDLNGTVWELDLENEGYQPTLWIDGRADECRTLPRSPSFAALIYPEVLRQVLIRVMITEGELRSEDDFWGLPWIRFARSLPGVDEDPPSSENEEDCIAWIRHAVGRFATLKNFCEVFATQAGEQS